MNRTALEVGHEGERTAGHASGHIGKFTQRTRALCFALLTAVRRAYVIRRYEGGRMGGRVDSRVVL